MHAAYVIKKPIVTEKSTLSTADSNQYVFLVDRRATKDDIKDAIESLYGVRPLSVTTQNRKGRRRRLKYGWVVEAVSKKATVRLAEGRTIEVI
ncbi:MAG: 50S ribosomal protein L23 [Planctomycetes bacterium]|nr:50S ribosomal protein L23 [Planctomycetota bacterium]MCH7960993.1 50S ribosomal protein L23 [Planctomycetota bacterium]MCH9057768.1 50S ribosomal protein L23 [Planctomycetota bacterium]